MISKVIKLFIVATSVTLLSFAPACDALHSLFQTMDQNEDGKLDMAEFSKNMTEYAFSRIDDNNNKAINRAEWDLIEKVTDRDKHDELFRSVDSDGNRVITPIEFSNYADKHSSIKETFATLDKDKDGTLSPKEIQERPLFTMVTIQL